MGCGTSIETSSKLPSAFQPKEVPPDPSPSAGKPNALTKVHNYDVWLHIFDYLTIRDLARVSQVCRSFYRISGDKKLFAKFENSKPSSRRPNAVLNKLSTFSPQTTPNNNRVINIEHHNEVYIFANSVVLPDSKNDPHYDIVTDQPGSYKTKNPIILNAFSDSITHDNKPAEDTFRQAGQMSRPTPKFVTPAGAANKRRFVFYCENEGVASQLMHSTKFPHSDPKGQSYTPSVTDHLDSPCAGTVPLHPQTRHSIQGKT